MKSAAWSARQEETASPLVPPQSAALFPSDDSQELTLCPSQRGAGPTTASTSSHPAGQANVSAPAGSPTLTSPPVWKKGLYERQPFEDNYVDPVLFLQELKKNSNVKVYQYSDVVKDTFVIVQQISFIVVFVYMFALIVGDHVEITTVILVDAVTLVAGAGSFLFLREAQGDAPPLNFDSVLKFGRSAVIFSTSLLLLSPIFQTLTITYTDDTIWALAIMAMFVHLLSSDYGYLNAVETRYVQGVGINAATFASLIMASRIRSPLFGAALVGFGVLCFNLSPIPRHYMKSYSLMAHVGATFLLCGVTMGCLLQVPLLAGLFASCVVLICFVVPWCFVKLQLRYKNQISGPWDEARPQNSLAAAEWANAGLLS